MRRPTSPGVAVCRRRPYAVCSPPSGRATSRGAVLMCHRVSAAVVHGENPASKEAPALYPPDAIKWQPGPPSLPKGAMMAVLEGDPTKAGPFVFRVKLPDGYRVPPHTHPKIERVTVIAGTFFIGQGDRFDPKKGHGMTA